MRLWDHNNHYHDYLLGQLPECLDRALDIGCGRGEFAYRLAERSAHVDAIDMDAAMIRSAQENQADKGAIQFIQGNFEEMDLPTEHYQVVSAIAALHHMDLTSALDRMAQLLALRGTLVILGLYKEDTAGGLLANASGIVAHNVYSRLIYRDIFQTNLAQRAPVMNPKTTLAEIKAVAKTIIPGARVRRHLLWRYSLVWRKP